jgi:hypothetical protein
MSSTRPIAEHWKLARALVATFNDTDCQHDRITLTEGAKENLRHKIAYALAQREQEVRERVVGRFMAIVKEIKGPNVPRVDLYEAMLVAGREILRRDSEQEVAVSPKTSGKSAESKNSSQATHESKTSTLTPEG